MKLKLILNPASGRGKAERRCSTIQKFFAQKKIAYDLERTTLPGQATLLAKKAVEAGFDTIVSVGGDGFTNEIANGIIGSGATLGIIPCGDANDFPKMFGISSTDVEEACQIISEGFTKTIDVGLVNGKYFVNVVGIGIDGEVTERKAEAKKYLRGFSGYYIQSLITFIIYKPKKVKIQINGISLETNLYSLSIGNGRFCGGGFQFTPDARIDDGILDCCLIKHPGKLRVFWDMPKVPRGEHIKLPYINVLKAKELTVISEEILVAHIDGEIAKAHKFEIKILPKKLKVLAKKPS